MTSIKLHGKLAESVGRDNWTLDISSVAEALHAINVQSKDGVKRFFLKRENAYSRYEVIVNGESLVSSENMQENELALSREDIQRTRCICRCS